MYKKFILLSSQYLATQAAKVKVKELRYSYQDSYADQEYTEIDLTLSTSSVTFSGWAGGGYLASNVLTMFNGNEQFKGGAITAASGYTCTSPGLCQDGKFAATALCQAPRLCPG